MIVEIVSARVVLVVENEGSKRRNAGSVRLFQRRVKKRQQRVTKLQILANDVFVILAEPPRFLIVTVNDLVVATERREKTDLIRTNQQLTVAAPDKPTNVAADKRLAR